MSRAYHILTKQAGVVDSLGRLIGGSAKFLARPKNWSHLNYKKAIETSNILKDVVAKGTIGKPLHLAEMAQKAALLEAFGSGAIHKGVITTGLGMASKARDNRIIDELTKRDERNIFRKIFDSLPFTDDN